MLGLLGQLPADVGDGDRQVGALEIHRAVAGGLSATERIDALLFADVAMRLILDRVQDIPTVGEHELFASEFAVPWGGIHRATDMVSVQLHSDLVTAFLRLRVHAFRTDHPLSTVADDVVEGRLRFTPDPADETGPVTDP